MSTLIETGNAITGALRRMEAAMVNAGQEELPELLGGLERIKAAAWARLAVPPQAETEAADRLLGAREAAEMLGIEVSALYRKPWPFRVKVSKGRTRYSLHGVQRFIRAREGH